MIDKSLRYKYQWGGPGGKSPGGGGSGPPGGGGGGGRGRDPSPPSRPAPSPHRDPTPVTTAVAPPSVLSRPTPTSLGDAPGREFAIATQNLPSIIDDYNYPGIDTDFDKLTRNIHVDTPEIKAEQDKLDIQQMIAKQQEEKYGDTADPTKFGETISKLDVAMSKDESDRTIEDKLAIEDWEKDQDWDKVKELADKGHSSDDIQKAMDKGLLLKEDAIRRQGLIERGLAAVMPKTKLESSLLGSLKKTFDPKRMATNFALKKMGLGWLNPLAGLASLFFPKQTATVKSKFAKKPAFDPAEASKLGLYAKRQPTTKQYTKDLTAPKDKFATQVAKGTGLESGAELLGLKEKDEVTVQLAKDVEPIGQITNEEKQKYRSQLDYVQGILQSGYYTNRQGETIQLTDDHRRQLSDYMNRVNTYLNPTAQGIAHGGRIDSPLMGGSRYI
jgi:hypothetical protein